MAIPVTNATPPNSGEKPCIFCGEGLRPGGVRCNKCNQNQSWTRECINCGRPMPQDAGYCKECNNYQDPESRCDSCRAYIPKGSKACLRCNSYQGPKVRCLSCRSYIPEESKICSRCNSVQFFWGYVNVSQLTLSLLVALISLLVAAVPLIKSLLARDHSKTSFSIVELTKSDKLMVLARNEGNEASYLKSVIFEFGRFKKTSRELIVEMGEANKDKVILPGKHRIFYLSVVTFDVAEEPHSVKALISGIREGDKPILMDAKSEDLAEFVRRKAVL